MSTATQDIMRVCESLPLEKQAEAADFARSLPARPDDGRARPWVAHPPARPRPAAVLSATASTGGAPPGLTLSPSRPSSDLATGPMWRVGLAG